jgi:radical SAM protein with 4Fe4S-binding SPASM domain
MDEDVYKKIIDEYVNGDTSSETVFLHLYGESLLHNKFDTFVIYAHEKKLRIGLSTNPIMLTDKIIKILIDTKIDELYFSLDGYDNASFERIRGLKDKYDISKIRLIKFLKEKVRKRNETDVAIGFINIPPPNSLEAQKKEEEYNFWRTLPGVNSVYKRTIRDWNGSIDEITALSENEPQRGLDAVLSSGGICMNPFRTLHVASDGSILACCYDYNNIFPLGNIRDISLDTAWNGEKLRSLRKELYGKKITNPLCVNCRFGGRLASSASTDG